MLVIGMNFKRKQNTKENIMPIILLCKSKGRKFDKGYSIAFFSQWFWQVFHKLDEKNKKKFLCKYSNKQSNNTDFFI
jgi:hypothetical protein